MKNIDIETIKAYWMATMAMGETREEMEAVWKAGTEDLMDWFEGELELGITEEEMIETIKEVEEHEARKKAEEEKAMANNAQVNIIEIEVEGIKYTQTRPGYYYKRVDGKNVRIPKAEWEQAFDAHIQTGRDNADADGWDMEQELRDRKDAEDKKDREAEDKKDREAEDAVNSKKIKKTRRSKDVAFEMDTIEGHITLTAKQVQFLKLLPDCSFWEEGLESSLWCDCIAQDIEWNPMSVGAMISTLREKGMVTVTKDASRQGHPKAMRFTVVGEVVAAKLGLK